MAANQVSDPGGQRFVKPRPTGPPAGASAHAAACHREDPTYPAFRHVRPRLLHSSDVFGRKGRSLLASLSTSRSSPNSPTFCLSFLICSSFSASSSWGRARRAFSAPSRNRSRHSSTSAPVNPCFRAAAWAELSPFRMLRISDARRFAVQRCGDSGLSSRHGPPPAVIHHGLSVDSIPRGAAYECPERKGRASSTCGPSGRRPRSSWPYAIGSRPWEVTQVAMESTGVYWKPTYETAGGICREFEYRLN